MSWRALALTLVLSGCITANPAEPTPEVAPDLHWPSHVLGGSPIIIASGADAPSELALAGFLQTLDEIVGDVPVTMVPHEFTATNWDRGAVAAAGDAVRRADALVVLYLPGGKDDAYGTYVNGTIAIFHDTIERAPLLASPSVQGPALPRHDEMERATLVHELGHAFGVVGCGIPQTKQRMDPESPCHSNDPSSTMHRGSISAISETGAYLQEAQEPIWRFSNDDLADIRAFQG